jgi:hypothetical protein
MQRLSRHSRAESWVPGPAFASPGLCAGMTTGADT